MPATAGAVGSVRRTVLWLRRDLRRADHPALLAAAEDGATVHPLFVVDPVLWRGAGAVRRAWLAASVRATAEAYDGRLSIVLGDPAAVVPGFVHQVGAGAVHVSAETTPYGRRRDRLVTAALGDVPMVATGTPYAVGPGLVRNRKGEPYQVFSPFAKAWRETGWPAPAPAPHDLRLDGGDVDDGAGRLLDRAVAESPVDLPAAGERAARRRWSEFVEEVAGYDQERDRPDHDGTSRLSPYLKVGALHPRTLLADLAPLRSAGAATFSSELAWREFYADVLRHAPGSAWHDLRPALRGLDYDDPGDAFDAWRQGRTGFPVVDAGLRQLLGTGWMHNRVRMIVASFLTKDLHTWWPAGARHFLDHLLDGDLASNNHNWQWVAGTGTDAAPYFRVFNPVSQGRRFDPAGDYVRRWVPELGHLEGAAVHEPWDHPDGYREGYPRRLVDHAEERRVALDRYRAARG